MQAWLPSINNKNTCNSDWKVDDIIASSVASSDTIKSYPDMSMFLNVDVFGGSSMSSADENIDNMEPYIANNASITFSDANNTDVPLHYTGENRNNLAMCDSDDNTFMGGGASRIENQRQFPENFHDKLIKLVKYSYSESNSGEDNHAGIVSNPMPIMNSVATGTRHDREPTI